ncbi:MAG: hypothetical protein U0271_14880 [Polyangiaceae bacterium]
MATLEDSAAPLENGYTIDSSGALLIAVRTDLPNCTPRMLDWWFGWHSDDPRRYKLWHPRAHVHASWAAPPAPDSVGRARYVGSTSIVDEYLGATLGRFRIRFIDPSELGLAATELRDDLRATAVCARVGAADLPLEAGWLVHHVRAVPGGAEMRSRFWIGGPYAALRSASGEHQSTLARAAVSLASRALRPTVDDGRDLLIHCAEEMSHLATFLPDAYGQFSK